MILNFLLQQMELWFDTVDCTGEKFDRQAMLKASLFDIFADHNRTPAVVDYISMVRNAETIQSSHFVT